MERRGSTAFLAHEDIGISKTWREEILAHLKSCQALIAIVTPNFEKSTYANQEAGIALGRGKPVITLNFAAGLPGFLESIQALHASEPNIGAAVEKAIKVIVRREPSTYIEPAFKTSQEIEQTAINEIVSHLLRNEPDAYNNIKPSSVRISKISLNEEDGISELSGSVHYYYSGGNYNWNWSMNIDARSGRILTKVVTQY